MRLTLLAVGKLKCEEAALFARYQKRIKGLRVLELSTQANLRQEQNSIEKAIFKGARLIVLDERGKRLNSENFASSLAKEGMREQIFVIGGARGLHDSLRERADLLLSFGAMTWPHQIVRLLLVEQLYRAQSILLGHPYHKV